MSQVYEIIDGNGGAEIVLLVDHASNYIPPEYANLGLPAEALQTHIAIDIGVAELGRRLALSIDATAVLACFSRLLIDPNRELGQDSLIPETSDNVVIPGNRGLSKRERQDRIDRFYEPYHLACAHLVDRSRTQAGRPLVIGLHSFTPELAGGGEKRPWHAALMWDTDPRLSRAIASPLEVAGFRVGYNDPYSGRGLFHSVRYHGGAESLPHTQIEVRQDLLSNEAGIAEWCDRLGKILGHLAEEF